MMNQKNIHTNNDTNDLENGKEETIFKKSSNVLRSPVLKVQAEQQGKDATKFERLGEKIEKLSEFLKGRSNIHKEIVTMTRELQALYLLAKRENNKGSSHEDKLPTASKESQTELLTVERESQTDARTPKHKDVSCKDTQTGERSIPLMRSTPTQKRSAQSMSPSEVKATKKKKKNILVGRKLDEAESTAVVAKETPVKQVEKQGTEWRTVKKPRDKPKKRRTRPDALVIHACSEMSYADILKKVKTDPKLTALGENVRTIRKSEKGELIVELTKPEHEQLTNFTVAVKEVLGSDADVRSVTQEILIDIRDIDEITTKEEVLEALVNFSEKMSNLQEASIKSLRRGFGGTQIATVGLSAPLANILCDAGKLRIGWVVCRVRQKLSPRKCFKCFEFGHISVNCKSEKDFTKCCIKCGMTGHKIRECKNKAKCLICNGEKQDICHITGSSGCPKFKKALKILKKKL